MYYSVFESTIRYLGGLISAYELSGKQHLFLIQKAQQLADRLSLGWSQVRESICCQRQAPVTQRYSRVTLSRLAT